MRLTLRPINDPSTHCFTKKCISMSAHESHTTQKTQTRAKNMRTSECESPFHTHTHRTHAPPIALGWLGYIIHLILDFYLKMRCILFLTISILNCLINWLMLWSALGHEEVTIINLIELNKHYPRICNMTFQLVGDETASMIQLISKASFVNN